MKRIFLAAVAALGLAGAVQAGAARAAGLQVTGAPDPDGIRMEVSIWYPSDTPARDIPMGPFTQHVAIGAPVRGTSLPLVILSHGTTASELNYNDTAIALADAGYVVAGLLHSGDNYRDSSRAFTAANFSGRPRQVSAVIDYMLNSWAGHASLDPARIGLLGHSAGGTTGLLIAGGALDWHRVSEYCDTHAADWACAQAAGRPASASQVMPAGPITGLDARVKAVAVAAPALAHGFVPDGLGQVSIPVQIWIGGRDEVVSDAARLHALLPGAEFHDIADAGHFAYLAPCSAELASIAPEICRDAQGFDRAAFLRQFQAGVIGFFDRRLH